MPTRLPTCAGTGPGGGRALRRIYRKLDVHSHPVGQVANRVHGRRRGPGERAQARLRSWRIPRTLRCRPSRAGRLAKAIHLPQDYEATAR